MERKTIYILIIITIWLIIGCIAFINITHVEKEQIQIGDSQFTLPDGYRVEKQESDEVSLTNGKVIIRIIEYNNTNINQYINEYDASIINQNQSNTNKNFTIDNIRVYKSINNNYSSVVHYWFVKNNKVYTIFTGDKNDHIDSIALGIMDTLTKI